MYTTLTNRTLLRKDVKAKKLLSETSSRNSLQRFSQSSDKENLKLCKQPLMLRLKLSAIKLMLMSKHGSLLLLLQEARLIFKSVLLDKDSLNSTELRKSQ